MTARPGSSLMTVEFAPGSCDPHGLELARRTSSSAAMPASIRDGRAKESPHTGYIFSIEIT